VKILQAPSNVCNIGWAFAQGLRGRGHHVEVWNLGASQSDFKLDRIFPAGRDPADYERCLKEALETNFDIFHFHGFSIYPNRRPMTALSDLPILKAHGKSIVFTFHGSDVRLKSIDIQDEWSFHRFADIPCDEERIRAKLDLIRSSADVLTVCNPLNVAYVPEAIYLPKAIDLSLYPAPKPIRERRPVILHAARRRETKGTAFIVDAIERLGAKGLDFNFRMVEGVSHAQVITEMANADILVEKVLSGDLGVIGLEAMAMGKVVVSRIRSEVYATHPNLPALDANPLTIASVLEDLLADASLRQSIASRGPAYVRSNHSAECIAPLLEQLYGFASKRGTS